jgi:hypothetical protein
MEEDAIVLRGCMLGYCLHRVKNSWRHRLNFKDKGFRVIL